MESVANKIVGDGKVSIIIPCFNQGDTLKETIDSIEKYRNLNLHEIIVVNDGSTDSKTLRLLSELEHSSCKVIHQFNMGLGPARNTGVKASTGEFILPLDGDNLIRGPYLNEGIAFLIANPSFGVVYGNAQYFGEKTGVWHVSGFDLAQLTLGNYIDACALIRRGALDDVGWYDTNMPHMGWEDWDLWMRLGSKGWKFHHLPEIAFEYRVRSGAMNCSANECADELKQYIFNKSENFLLSLIRDQQLALHFTRSELIKFNNSKILGASKKILMRLTKLRNHMGTGVRWLV